MLNVNGILSGLATPWELVLVLDTLIFSLTLYKALWEWKDGHSRLVLVLLRDGKQFT